MLLQHLVLVRVNISIELACVVAFLVGECVMRKSIIVLFVLLLSGCASKPSLFDRCGYHVDASLEPVDIYEEDGLARLYRRLNSDKPVGADVDLIALTEGALMRSGSVDVSRIVQNMTKAQMVDDGAGGLMASSTAYLSANTYRANATAAPIENLCSMQKSLIKQEALLPTES